MVQARARAVVARRGDAGEGDLPLALGEAAVTMGGCRWWRGQKPEAGVGPAGGSGTGDESSQAGKMSRVRSWM
ncbi:MAG: hypothetical protein U0232_15340 [Thermomicrobiales bacterium]